MYNKEQVLKGIIEYVDTDVINKVPTLSKWLIGAGVSMAMDNAKEIIETIQTNEMVKSLGVVDEVGNIDVETVADYLCQAAQKYGNVSINIPLLGTMTFSAHDIENIKNHIRKQ